MCCWAGGGTAQILSRLHMEACIEDAAGSCLTLSFLPAGLYGSMNSLLYDHAVVAPRPLRIIAPAPDQAPSAASATLLTGSVFGPSCDGLDTVLRDYLLPRLNSGDWLVFGNHGAYTFCGACAFNGMDPTPATFYIFSET